MSNIYESVRDLLLGFAVAESLEGNYVVLKDEEKKCRLFQGDSDRLALPFLVVSDFGNYIIINFWNSGGRWCDDIKERIEASDFKPLEKQFCKFSYEFNDMDGFHKFFQEILLNW